MPCVPDMHQAFLFPERLERALPSPQRGRLSNAQQIFFLQGEK